MTALHEEAAAAAAAAAAALAPRAVRLSAAVHQLQLVLLPLLQPSAAFLGCLLPGHALSAALLLVEDSCCWIVYCLEVNQDLSNCDADQAADNTETFA
jgi:hypothetical protein